MIIKVIFIDATDGEVTITVDRPTSDQITEPGILVVPPGNDDTIVYTCVFATRRAVDILKSYTPEQWMSWMRRIPIAAIWSFSTLRDHIQANQSV
jgi:hypothetical protein